MPELIRTKVIVLVAAAGLVSGGMAVVAMAAPGGNEPAGAEVTETATETATETPAATATATEEDAETLEATETPEAEHGEGVPLDSPACAGNLEDPNPHDTDGDGDGCREVGTDDGGTINLPDPAADAHDGNHGLIGQEHRPTGEPPFGHGHDDGEGETPEPTETG